MEKTEKINDESNQLIFHPEEKIRLMLVDDEESIIKALKRVFRGSPFEISSFTSGAEALDFLKNNAVDVVISDMRMPEMDGQQFLLRVSELYPGVMRIVLTGYAELDNIIDVINNAKIYSFVTKPWDDVDLKLKVQHAAEKKYMKYFIQDLVRKRNDELKVNNDLLEEKVRERTSELEQRSRQLEESYRDSLRMIAFFAEQNHPGLQEHSEQVSRLMSRFALWLGLQETESSDLVSAARLHDIGLAVMEDGLLKKAPDEMSAAEKKSYLKHPVLGENILMGLHLMNNVAEVVRHHHEDFNGEGFPNGLSGETIPLGARMLRIINDYNNMTQGFRNEYRFSSNEALETIIQNAFGYYDPRLANEFVQMMQAPETEDFLSRKNIWSVNADELKPGMVLYENLVSKDGMLLLTAGSTLTGNLINSIHHVKNLDELNSKIYVIK